MPIDDTDITLEVLNRLFGEAWHRSEFTVYTDSLREITVTILDGGPANPKARYCAKATTEDGRQAGGNPCESIGSALDLVHWNEIGLRWTAGKLTESRPLGTPETD